MPHVTDDAHAEDAYDDADDADADADGISWISSCRHLWYIMIHLMNKLNKLYFIIIAVDYRCNQI